MADKKKYQTDGKKLLEEATVVVNGQKREVVNLLDGSATFFDGEEKVVNIALTVRCNLFSAVCSILGLSFIFSDQLAPFSSISECVR